jgi:hypothetical protein
MRDRVLPVDELTKYAEVSEHFFWRIFIDALFCFMCNMRNVSQNLFHKNKKRLFLLVFMRLCVAK